MTNMVKQNTHSEYAFGRFVIRKHSLADLALRIAPIVTFVAQVVGVTLFLVGMTYLPGLIINFF